MRVIYVLLDPRTSQERYVGATGQTLAQRLGEHVHAATKKRATSQCCEWIRELKANGLRPKIKLFKKLETIDWETEERAAIAFLKQVGAPLLNQTEGGMGMHGHVQDDVTRKERSQRCKERLAASPDAMKKITEIARNAGRTPKALEAARLRMESIWGNPERAREWKEKISQGRRRANADRAAGSR